MQQPVRRTFDIFSGVDQDALWIEAVEGLEEARKRMREIAAGSPGDYFIFDTGAGQIVDRIQSSRNQKGEKWEARKGW